MTAGGPALLDGGPAPRPECGTLGNALVRAALAPAGPGLCFVGADGGETGWSYAQLLHEAARLLAGMRRAGTRPGERVVVHVADAPGLLSVFWACVLGGFVPLLTGTGTTAEARAAAPALLDQVWNRYGRPRLVTGRGQPLRPGTEAAARAAGAWLGHPHELRAAAPDHRRHPSRPDDLAALLLTSGSTGVPKAVLLSHRNILSRSAATARVNGLGRATRSVNWMPLDHAGGLLLFHVRDVFLGAHQVHAPTEWVLADPLRWLDLVDRHRACTTWAPNFAFSLVNDRADRLADRHWDLSGLRYVMNGGEAVRASVVRRFLSLLAPFGLPPDAMFPGWGMSETAAGVVDCRFSDLDAVTRYVPAGRPQPGTAVRCVDADGALVPAGTVGHLEVRGPSVTRGYLDDAAHTRRAFTADGWFRTGDLAFVQDGVLTVTGRADDLVECDGVRCHSHEIEAVVEELDFVAPSHTVACPVTAAEGEEIAVFYHPRPGTGHRAAEAAVRARVAERLGVRVARVVAVDTGDVPRTGIGKLRRARMRHWYETRDGARTAQRHDEPAPRAGEEEDVMPEDVRSEDVRPEKARPENAGVERVGPEKAGPRNARVENAVVGDSGTDGEALRVSVLGPLEIRSQNAERTPSAPMARRVLAMLLLNANRLVSTSTLIEELWETEPPRLARKTVQTYVYQLRKALHCPVHPCERVRTGPNGYRIDLRPGELDLWEFEHGIRRARTALGEGDPRTAATLARAALGLWRGEPFAGLEAGPLLSAQLPHLADLRLSALELRITADLRLGRHRDLMGELRQLTADHPLNEEFTAQLMTAAQRSGQRATALEAFARLRRRLVDELGIEPSERLQRLQREVLTAQLPEPVAADVVPVASAPPEPRATAAVTEPVRGRLPLDTPDFTGRTVELARLAALAGEDTGERDPAGGGPRVVVVLGPVGVGKSALAVRGAHRLAGRFPDGALHARLHDNMDRPRPAHAVLHSLLRDCGHDPAALPHDTDELAGMFRSASAGRSLLMLLDDAATTDQVLPLLPADDTALVLVTSRVRLPGLPGARALPLGPLPGPDASAFFARVAGVERVAGDADTLGEVTRLMGNFPLALRAVGEKFAGRPMWTLPDLALGLVDEGRLAAELHDEACDVLARTAGAVARLPAPLRRALILLAAAGDDPFGMARAQQALGGDAWEAQSLVGQLLDHHVVVTDPRPAGEPSLALRVPHLIRMSLPSPDDTGLRVLPGADRDLGPRTPSGVLTAAG
ncbi:AMP-binding protein [Streptomyces ziwulingensis]|uniref:OmpR/PhoB-type domain-containing protein n=1 Tax=Streptomyces ziwulingensis TaxID=1045501 RepID=A0ABP9BUQ5_9ACTN